MGSSALPVRERLPELDVDRDFLEPLRLRLPDIPGRYAVIHVIKLDIVPERWYGSRPLESIRAAYATSVLHIPLGFLTRDGLTMRLRFAEG